MSMMKMLTMTLETMVICGGSTTSSLGSRRIDLFNSVRE